MKKLQTIETFLCPKCHAMKERSDFYGQHKRSGWCRSCSRARSTAYYATHKESQRQAHRKWVLAHPERIAAHKAKSAYGLAYEEYERLMRSGRCAICGNPEKLRIDHCHQSQLVRGILCDRCNKGLGFFRDNPAHLSAAIFYLANPPAELALVAKRPFRGPVTTTTLTPE